MVEAAVALDYPLRLLVLAIDIYLGVRHISLDGAVHTGILAHGGMLAGCGQATSLARAHLHEPLGCAYGSVSGLRLREWVDDVSARLFGTHSSISATFPTLLRALLVSLKRCLCQLAVDESHMLASSPELRSELSSAALAEGCEFKVSLAARDLGHDTALGARRTVAVRKVRFS